LSCEIVGEHVATELCLALCGSVWVTVFWDWFEKRRGRK